jgi:S-DNA-T family DNA segregation ATPase FtsK/SpoIIIE
MAFPDLDTTPLDPVPPSHSEAPAPTYRRRAAARLLALLARLPFVREELRLLTDVRRYRIGRPRWQRIAFVAVLGALLAGILGPGEVLVAALGLVPAVLLWPVVGWAGRLLAVGTAGGWSLVLLGWRNAIPVAALIVFAHWFCTTASAGGPVTAVSPPDHDHQDDLGPDDVDAATGLEPGDPVSDGTTDPTAVLPPVLATPDPEQYARVEGKLACWDQIAPAAGLPGTQLQDVQIDAYGWSAGLLLPLGRVLKQALEARTALESALEVRPRAVRIEEDPTLARRVRLRVVERDPFASPIPYPGPTMGSITRPMLLGAYEDGLPCTADLSQQHVFIVGATGSGKSVLLNVVLSELAAAGDVVPWGIDFKGGAELGPWRDCLDRIATTPEEAEQLLQAAVAVLEARAARGQKHWPTGPQWPELKIVVDEHAELVRTCPKAMALEESIANRGRSVGVSLVVTSLRATHETLGSDQLRQQLRVRICMGLEDPKDAELIFGSGAARRGWDPELLDAPGKFFLRARSQGLVIPRVARGFDIADQMVHQLNSYYRQHATRLDPAPSQPAADRFPPPPRPTLPPPPADSTTPPAWNPPPPPPPTPTTTATHDPASRLLAALSAAGTHGAKVVDLVERTGQPGPTIHAQLVALEAAGTVQRAGKGRWRLAQPDTRP